MVINMDGKSFIELLKNTSRIDAIKTTISLLEDLDGKGYNEKMKKMCYFYSNLKNIDKKNINNIIKLSVDTSFFNFLCVIDGVSAIENGPNKGDFKLYYIKNNKNILLNCEEDLLHDYYDISEFF